MSNLFGGWVPGDYRQNLVLVAMDVAVAVLVALAAWLVARLADRIIDRSLLLPAGRFRYLDPGRARTLSGLLRSLVNYGFAAAALLVIAGLFVPSAVLPAAGLAGLVGAGLGFGAQNFVRDVIAGILVIYEDQFRVGEQVQLCGVSGTVVDIGFRITRLRDAGGQLHIVPNGKIDLVTNSSRGDQSIVVDLAVPYDEDPGRIESAIAEACNAAAGTDGLVEGPRLLGLGELREQAVVYQVWARCRPLKQPEVGRAIRQALVASLARAGIPRPPLPGR